MAKQVKLKYHPTHGGNIIYPEDWSEEQVQYLLRAFETGKKVGRMEVVDPIIDALGIREIISDEIRSSS